MTRPALLLVPALLTLSGCDAAKEIAGDTLEAELRNTIVMQCEGVAEGAGVAAGRVSAVCQCSADKMTAEGVPTMADVTPQRLQGIITACVAETDPDGVGQ